MANTRPCHSRSKGNCRPAALQQPLAAACVNFLDYMARASSYSPSTVRAYSIDLAQFLRFAQRNGVHHTGQVDARLVELFKDSLAHLKPTTVCRKLAAVSAFFDWLWRHGHVASNPVGPVKRPKKRAAETKWVTPEDAVALLAACRDDRERAIIATFLRAALRCSELINLRLRDVDLVRNELHITGKGGVRRTVPILSDLRPYLVRWLAARGELDHDFVFTTRTGRPLYHKACWRLFRRLLKKAGLEHKGYTVHSLRHGAATQMYEAGVDIGVIARFLRHADLSTVSRYVHASAEAVRRQVEDKLSGQGFTLPPPPCGTHGELRTAVKEAVIEAMEVLLGLLRPCTTPEARVGIASLSAQRPATPLASEQWGRP